jgi:hypothetical protein
VYAQLNVNHIFVSYLNHRAGMNIEGEGFESGARGGGHRPMGGAFMKTVSGEVIGGRGWGVAHLFAEEEMAEAASEGERRLGALGCMVGWKAYCSCVGCGIRVSRVGQRGLGRGKRKKEKEMSCSAEREKFEGEIGLHIWNLIQREFKIQTKL